MKPSKPSNRVTRSFQRLARDYYDETFERYPVWGGQAGIKNLQSNLGRSKPAVHERQVGLASKTLAALEAMPVHAFEGDDLLDRLTLRSHLRHELMMAGDLKTWRTNPQIHLDRVSEGLYTLIVRHGDRLKPVAEALVARLRAIPRYLDEAAECIKNPVPTWTRLAQESAPGVCTLIMSLPSALVEVTSHDEKKLTQWAREAVKAVRTYARRIGRRHPGPEGGFAIGPERFERLIRDRMGLAINAREAHCAAMGLIDSLKIELRAEARRFHPRKSASEILAEAAEAWKFDGRDLIGAYRKQTKLMKARFKQAGAMTFPRGDALLVKPVPEFMIHQFPTAAYSSPGPFEKDQTGIFWVNDLSQRQPSAAARQKEIAQHFGIELTSAHEAYPGHHLQFVTQNRHPSRVRRMADHAIYYEGWTLWCEQMSVDLGVSGNPYLRLIQLHDALWRANRIVVDCGLQTGALTYDGACRRLMREVGFTRARARADVNWYTSSPTVPMSYLLGKMEVLRLKKQRVDRGGWTLKRFNDWILSFGAIPWSWIEASGL